VNDHLRLLAAGRPVEREGADAAALMPWLAEKLDFSPAVPTDGTELHLRGAALGYVFDRKAAVLLYTLRLHQLTLLAFPAAGLAWPGDAGRAGAPTLERSSERGFHAILWRAGDLGYALVSDSNPEELAGLASRLARAAEETGR
jgi:anti-sigma factor RsiW